MTAEARTRKPRRKVEAPEAYTVVDLDRLDRDRQSAANAVTLAALTVSGASVPEAPVYAPAWSGGCGLPEGSTFLPVAARLTDDDMAAALRSWEG